MPELREMQIRQKGERDQHLTVYDNERKEAKERHQVRRETLKRQYEDKLRELKAEEKEELAMIDSRQRQRMSTLHARHAEERAAYVPPESPKAAKKNDELGPLLANLERQRLAREQREESANDESDAIG